MFFIKVQVNGITTQSTKISKIIRVDLNYTDITQVISSLHNYIVFIVNKYLEKDYIIYFVERKLEGHFQSYFVCLYSWSFLMNLIYLTIVF